MIATSPAVIPLPPIPGPMALIAPQPRYLQLAQTLISEIESGRYPVGA